MCNPQILSTLNGGGQQPAATGRAPSALPPPNWAEAPTPYNAKYSTPLTPQEEPQFQAWRDAHNIRIDPNYDMRGYWKAMQSGDPYAKQGDNGHFPDTYKKPGHETFSDESQYSGRDGNVGGHWVQDSAGNWVGYDPSATNLKYRTPQQLQAYFDEVEPETQLRIIGGQMPTGVNSPIGQIFSRGVWAR